MLSIAVGRCRPSHCRSTCGKDNVGRLHAHNAKGRGQASEEVALGSENHPGTGCRRMSQSFGIDLILPCELKRQPLLPPLQGLLGGRTDLWPRWSPSRPAISSSSGRKLCCCFASAGGQPADIPQSPKILQLQEFL